LRNSTRKLTYLVEILYITYDVIVEDHFSMFLNLLEKASDEAQLKL
jgi:hypothetical protein